MNAALIELLAAMSAELKILRGFLPDDVPYVDKLHLDAAEIARQRTERAAIAYSFTSSPTNEGRANKPE
jgi:hypothetical protein